MEIQDTWISLRARQEKETVYSVGCVVPAEGVGLCVSGEGEGVESEEEEEEEEEEPREKSELGPPFSGLYSVTVTLSLKVTENGV